MTCAFRFQLPGHLQLHIVHTHILCTVVDFVLLVSLSTKEGDQSTLDTEQTVV